MLNVIKIKFIAKVRVKHFLKQHSYSVREKHVIGNPPHKRFFRRTPSKATIDYTKLAVTNHIEATKTRSFPRTFHAQFDSERSFESEAADRCDFTLAFSLTHPPSSFDGFSPVVVFRARRGGRASSRKPLIDDDLVADNAGKKKKKKKE